MSQAVPNAQGPHVAYVWIRTTALRKERVVHHAHWWLEIQAFAVIVRHAVDLVS